MNNVPAVPPVSTQVLEPVTEGSVDDMRDTLVPAQEDELPQGVQDLLATLSVRHRSRVSAVQGFAGSESKAPGPMPATFGPSSQRPPEPVSHPLLQRRESVAPVVDRTTTLVAPVPFAVTPTTAATLDPVGAGLPTKAASLAPIDSKAAPAETFAAASVPKVLHNLQALHLAPSVAPPPIHLPSAPMPRPAFDMKVQMPPDPSRGLLQIPFNKGTVSGQVTITREPDESTRNLLLSPSNALVFEQLKAPFELVRDPGWRLNDDSSEQQHQGTHQSPEEEQTEQQEVPA
ncbi:SpaN/EivJ family type III secretion system needle length determinant [Pseudomonas sp. ZT5P21]